MEDAALPQFLRGASFLIETQTSRYPTGMSLLAQKRKGTFFNYNRVDRCSGDDVGFVQWRKLCRPELRIADVSFAHCFS
jgi:hypothetical protein